MPLHHHDYSGILALLGKLPDSELAARVGGKCARQHIFRLRKQLAILSWAEQRRNSLAHVLGRYPDTELSKSFGLSLKSVRKIRRKLGIPAARRRKGKARRSLLERYIAALDAT